MINIIKRIKLRRMVCFLVTFLSVMSIYSLAMNSANYAIDWDVINGGGDNANATSYRIKASAGQSAIDLTAATTYQSEGGYWSGVDEGVVFSYQSDNHIKNSSEGTYIGDNIYNGDGTNQTKAQSVDNDATAIYHIRLENDGNNSDTFVATGTGGATDWTVAYYDALSGGSDITGSVTGAGWSSGVLASGATRDIRVEVTPGAGAGGGTSREILITSTSQGDANADTVKAATTVNSGYQSDNHIKNSSEGTYIGDNIYNGDGTNQTKAQSVDNDATATYHIRLENDGNNSDTFVVTGTGGATDWTVAYYDALSGGSDITGSVTGAGWSSGVLASGATRDIRVEVTPGAGAGGGTSREILITSTSQGDANADTVKAATTVNSGYQSDNHIKNSSEGTYIGDNIYNGDGTNQTKAQSVDNDATATYHIRLENDGNNSDTFVVTGSGGATDWTVAYYDALVAGSDITGSVTGGGWNSGALASGATRDIRVEVTPGAGAGGGTSREILITSTSQGDSNVDTVKAATTVNSGYQSDNHIKNSSEGTYIGDNIYNGDGTNQTKAQSVDNDATATYHIRLENDGNNSDTFVVTGIGGATDWTVAYYDALSGGSDITGSVTGGGWNSGALASGATREIRVEVTPGAGAGGGTSREILITSTSQGDSNVDTVKAATTVNSGYRADNQIKNSSEGTYTGDNIYNGDGTNQTKSQSVDNDATATYHIRLENDGNNSDTFVVTGTGGATDWTVAYYDALSGGSDITGSVTGAGWNSGALASGATRDIRVEVTPGAGAGGGTSREILITSTSQGDSNADTVKAATMVNGSVNYQTDSQIKNSSEGTYIGDDIYDNDGSQFKDQNVNNDETAIYHIKVENDGNSSDTFVANGNSGDADWTVIYYDALSGGSDITGSVTGGGWSTGVLASGASTEIRMEITPGAEVSMGTVKEIMITATSQGDSNSDTVKACTACGSFFDEVSCSFTDIVPEFIELEKEESLLRISLNVSEHDAIWNGLRIVKIGTIQDINVVAVRVYMDDGNQQFDGSDTLVGGGTFSNGEVDIEFTTPQTINTAIKSYFVTCEIGDNAGIGTTIGFTCDPGLFTIVSPDSMDSELYSFDTRTAMIVEVILSKTKLHPNYPNPFRPSKGETTTIQYDLGEDVNSIEIEIYNLAGGLVRKWSGNIQRGRHRISWDASNQGGRMISSGMYFIVIKKNGKVMDRKRIVVIK